ncbi:MAG: hypothetical protein CMO55_14075 [Verrucomicrobiales bacterium]|nr:hypothetical protein [Verrucomicrobiales bacterium]
MRTFSKMTIISGFLSGIGSTGRREHARGQNQRSGDQQDFFLPAGVRGAVDHEPPAPGLECLGGREMGRAGGRPVLHRGASIGAVVAAESVGWLL